MSASKKRQTMAKISREREVKQKRELKAAKKAARRSGEVEGDEDTIAETPAPVLRPNLNEPFPSAANSAPVSEAQSGAA